MQTHVCTLGWVDFVLFTNFQRQKVGQFSFSPKKPQTETSVYVLKKNIRPKILNIKNVKFSTKTLEKFKLKI